MRYLAHLSALSFLCLFGSQHVDAMDAVHAGAGIPVGEAGSAGIGSPRADRAGRCPGLAVEIVASSVNEHALACSAAAVTLRLLDRCNIGLKRLLRVEIMEEVRHPFSGPILGMFDTAQERVLIAREASVPALIKDTPYADLPLRDFYSSLVVHEIVHGVMRQNFRRKPTTHAAHEYPAYALQLESLPADVREAFLRSFDPAALRSNSLFSDTVLFFDPYFFAARAYHHYRAAPDVCAQLAGLLSDDVAFIAPPM